MTVRTSFLLITILTGTFALAQGEAPDTRLIPHISGEETIHELAEPEPGGDEIYAYMEVMPSFPGGAEAMHKYIAEQITLPKEAADAGIQGVVYVNFVVEKDGTLSKAKVLRGIGGGCDEEALRMLESMPTWEPGTHRGEPRRVYFNLPIRFDPRD